MDSTTDNILVCQNASFGYDGHIVVSDISFTLKRGDYLCIIGENGSGKSTLVKGILRLINPARGKIFFEDGIKANETGCLTQQEAAKKDFPAGVMEIVLSGFSGSMGLRPFYTRKERAAAEINMGRMEVTGLKNRCFRELSGGQQRRVLIARALCAAKKLLVLDEPAAGLDPIVTNELYELLVKINQDAGITIIMVTHDIQAAVKYGKRILHLSEKNHFYGTPRDWQREVAPRARFGEV